MNPPIAASLLASLTLLLGAPGAAAQVREATIPRPGQIWLEVEPSLESWSEVYTAADDEGEGSGAASRRPLAELLGGPIENRLFPGIGSVVSELNEDAAALGFAPLSEEEVSLGGLDFGTVSSQMRRVEGRLEIGILGFLSVEAAAPAVFTEVEPFFAFDSAAATLIPAGAVLASPDAFFDDFDQTRAQLQSRVDEGSLTPDEEAAALQLLARAAAFRGALGRRIAEDRLIPLGATAAGVQIGTHYDSLAAGFEQFGLGLPEFDLPDVLTRADLAELFGSAAIRAMAPGESEKGWTVPHVEAGLRIALLDRFSDPDAAVRHRTTVGARVRLPLRGETGPPVDDPADFFDLPIGDRGTDYEIGLQQDWLFGRAVRLNASGRYGIRGASRRRVRVHSIERPFGLAFTETSAEVEPGDYLTLTAVPQLQLNAFLSVGVAYGYWHEGEDRVELLTVPSGLVDGSPLERGSEQTRHRLGASVILRTGEDRGIAWRGERPGAERPTEPDEIPGGAPWRFSFTIQGTIAGSGGRTPASQLVAVTIRAPISIF